VRCSFLALNWYKLTYYRYTVSRFENGGGARVDSLAQIQDALEEEGIVFVPADAAGGPGVRIAKRNP
jgi:hypothetical protein